MPDKPAVDSTRPSSQAAPSPAVQALLASLRSRPLAHLDVPLAACFTFVLALGGGFVAYLHSVDVPLRRDAVTNHLPDAFPSVPAARPVLLHRGVIPKLPKIGEPPVREKAAPPKPQRAPHAPPSRAKQRSRTKRSRTAAPSRGRRRLRPSSAASRRARLAAAVRGLRVFKLLGSPSSRRGSAVRDLLRRGDPGKGLDAALRGATRVTMRGRSRLGVRSGTAQRATIGDFGTGIVGPKSGSTGTIVREHIPKPEVIAPRPHTCYLPNNDLIRAMKLLLPAFKACYRRVIRRSPTVAGKISLRVNISAVGRATSVSIEHDTTRHTGLKRCVTRAARRMRVPARARGGEVALPLIFRKR